MKTNTTQNMRKRRTRQHFIEDLGFNYAEKQALLGMCTLARKMYDYGIDAEMVTFSDNGEVENGLIHFQIKSTDKIKYVEKKDAYAFDLQKKDLEYWLAETITIYILLYDAQRDIAYVLDLQKYFKENRLLLKNINKFIRIYIPTNNKFTVEEVLNIRNYKNSLRERSK